MKAQGLVVLDKKIFENCILKTYFFTPWLTYATNQNHLNNVGGDHQGTIPVEFGQVSISGSKKEVVRRFPYIIQCEIVTPGRVNFNPRGIVWTTVVEDL